MLRKISEKQRLARDAIATKSRYPLMDRGEKNTHDNFYQMTKAFESQMKQAKLSLSIVDHMICLYNNFLDKLQKLYMTLSEYNFDEFDENGLFHNCPSLDWCQRVKNDLGDVMEYPFHQQFMNRVIFANPNYKYNYELYEDHLQEISGSVNNEPISPNDIGFTKMSGTDVLPSSAYDSVFTFNAYGSTVSDSSTPTPAFTSSINLSYKTMRCRTVMNVLTEEWRVSNLDNSLPGVLLKYYGSNFPSAYVWKLFDVNYFCEALANSADESHDLSGTFGPGTTSQFVVEFMEVIYNWMQGVERNLMEVEKEKRVIVTIHETSGDNYKIAREQLEIHSEVDEDELMAMIESGNVVKTTLAKLPPVGHANIFTPAETKAFLSGTC